MPSNWSRRSKGLLPEAGFSFSSSGVFFLEDRFSNWLARFFWVELTAMWKGG
jgi:hypothetical protein